MRCPTTDSVFLRANGRFVCWDDAGSDRVLARYPAHGGTDWVETLNMARAASAEALSGDRLPDAGVCPGCFCLSPRGSCRFHAGYLDVMQVEPSSRCELRCLACASEEERNGLEPPYQLSSTVFGQIMKDMKRGNLAVNAFDFSGHGEPLLNPEVFSLTSIARKYHPDSFISLCTSGNSDFDNGIMDSGIDQVQVAVDGVDRESYLKYRVGGDFDRAWEFLRNLSLHPRRKDGPQVVWRYILFRHNSSPRQLSRVWEMAVEAGVDQVRFIFTHRGPWSRDINDAGELAEVMRNAGVPRSCLRIDTPGLIRTRTGLRLRLISHRRLYRIGRRAWSLFRTGGRNRSRTPVVTADYCCLRPDDMRSFISIGLQHIHAGRRDAAGEMYSHIQSLIRIPARHNSSYLASEMEESLGEDYDKLRMALENYGTVL
jgi:MoaA/NifB/PqqE/SkfB family radical SAM enzyme